MKKSIASMIIAVLSLLAIIFCVLWQHTVHDQTDFTTFAQKQIKHIPVSRPIKKVGMTATIGRALLRFMRSKKHMAF